MADNKVEEYEMGALLTEIFQCWKENNLEDVKEKVLQFNELKEKNKDCDVFQYEWDLSPLFNNDLGLEDINETLDYILNNLDGFYDRKQSIWQFKIRRFEILKKEVSLEDYHKELIPFIDSFIEDTEKLQELDFRQFYDLIRLCVIDNLFDKLEELRLKFRSIIEENEEV